MVGDKHTKPAAYNCPCNLVVTTWTECPECDLRRLPLPSANFSDDGVYRYRLERTFAVTGRVIAALMVNPSKANATANDPTIRRWLGFGERLGARRIIVGNKFAFCATDIKELARLPVDVAVGPDNDKHLEQIMRDADLHIVAWGPLAKLPKRLRKRWHDVVRIADRVGCPLYALGTAQDGHPRHPLMLGYDQAHLTTWEAPWFPNR